jgi:hypothetical protein
VPATARRRTADAEWFAEGTHGEGRETNIAGWDGLAQLLAEVDVQQMETAPEA